MIPIRELKSRERWVSCFPKALPMGVVGAADAGKRNERLHTFLPEFIALKLS